MEKRQKPIYSKTAKTKVRKELFKPPKNYIQNMFKINAENLNLEKNMVEIFTLFILVILTFWLCSCGKTLPPKHENSQLKIVSTTTMIHDLVGVIGGDKVESVGLMGAGIDPHLYNATAGDVAKIENADIVVHNGLHLEGKMGEVFETLNAQKKHVVCLADAIDESKLLFADKSTDAHDAHIWFDAKLWGECAFYLAEKLATIDGKNASVYRQNYDEYAKELEQLEEYIKTNTTKVKQEQRVLITAHDAFGYFGAAYDFEVIGLQGTSTQTQAGTADVSELAQFIAQNKIKAIFVESSIAPKTIEALKEAVRARGFDVEIGGELYSDSLGDEKSEHGTYIQTFKANVDTIVNALM